MIFENCNWVQEKQLDEIKTIEPMQDESTPDSVPEEPEIIEPSICLPENVPNLETSLRKKVKGIYGIAYNKSKKQYVVGVSDNNDFIILDKDFNIVMYWKTTKTLDYVRQGLDTEGDFVYLAESFKGNNEYNIVAIYTWDGQYVGMIKIKKGQEVENVFHANGKFYAGFYEAKYVRQHGKLRLVRSGYVYQLQFKNSATIIYSGNGGKGKMSNSRLYYGITRNINTCKFKKKGYAFKGWTAYRTMDNKYYGYNKKGKLAWYSKKEIKTYKLYKNKAKIAKTASKGTIKFTAKWKKI